MMKKLLFFAFCLIPCFVFSEITSKRLSSPHSQASRCVALSGLEEYRTLKEKEGNFLISPYSIATSLGMIALAAERETKEQLVSQCHFPKDQEVFIEGFKALHQAIKREDETYDIACRPFNAVWTDVDLDVPTEFLVLNEKIWEALPSRANYKMYPEKVRTQINQKIEEKTQGLIEEFLPVGSITTDSRATLTSVLYFKAPWKFPFQRDFSYMGSFFTDESHFTLAEFMSQTVDLRVSQQEGYKIVEIPYLDDSLVFVVALPNEGFDLSVIEDDLTLPTIDQWFQSMKTERVLLALPKFEATFATSLREILFSMGVDLPFKEEGGLPWVDSSGQPVVLQDLLHTSTLLIDEAGTTAAAASSALIGVTSWKEPTPFLCNRPFVFMVIDKQARALHFLGRLTTLYSSI